MIHTQMELVLATKALINNSQRKRKLGTSLTHLMMITRIQVMIQSNKWHLRKLVKFCLLLIKFHKSQLPNNNSKTINRLPNNSSSISLLSNNCLLCSKIIRNKQLQKKDWLSLTTKMMMMKVSSQRRSPCLQLEKAIAQHPITLVLSQWLRRIKRRSSVIYSGMMTMMNIENYQEILIILIYI